MMSFLEKLIGLVMLQETDKKIVLKDGIWPERSLSWPKDRTLTQYFNFLMAPLSFDSLSQEEQLPNIAALLALAWQANIPMEVADNELLQQINPDGKPIVVDIGVGDGNALAAMKNEGLVTVGFGLHEIHPQNEAFIDLLCYTSVPDGSVAQRMFRLLRGKVAMVVEVYGAVTYANNPIHAALFAGLLLAPNGTAKIIMSSIPKEENEQSPLGFASERKCLIEFFKAIGLELTISRTYIKSRVIPGSYCVDYLLEIKRDLFAKVTDMTLDELFALANEQIGFCSHIPKKSQSGEFGRFSIQGRTYTRSGNQTQFAALDISEDISSAFRLVGESNPLPNYTLSFSSDKALNEFTIRFSEYYLNNQRDSLWSMQIDTDHKKVNVTYQNFLGGLSVLQKAKEEITRVFPELITKKSDRNRFFMNPKVIEYADTSSNSLVAWN